MSRQALASEPHPFLPLLCAVPLLLRGRAPLGYAVMVHLCHHHSARARVHRAACPGTTICMQPLAPPAQYVEGCLSSCMPGHHHLAQPHALPHQCHAQRHCRCAVDKSQAAHNARRAGYRCLQGVRIVRACWGSMTDAPTHLFGDQCQKRVCIPRASRVLDAHP